MEDGNFYSQCMPNDRRQNKGSESVVDRIASASVCDLRKYDAHMVHSMSISYENASDAPLGSIVLVWFIYVFIQCNRKSDNSLRSIDLPRRARRMRRCRHQYLKCGLYRRQQIVCNRRWVVPVSNCVTSTNADKWFYSPVLFGFVWCWSFVISA